MAFEKITLDINANGEMPTFHCKQFDIGRPIIIDLVAGEDDYTPAAGVTFELYCRKVDMNLVVISDYEIDSNQITFASTEQLTACVGDNIATLKLFKDELEIATMNFIINVAIDPEAQGIVSDTVIDNLTTQIEEITEQVIGDNYYDKEEVDDLLDLKADAADVYTKTETDTLLSAKADKSDTYTKSQVDSALTLKADKSDTYTKAQVDSALSAKANTADLATVATTGDYDDLTNKPVLPDMSLYYTKTQTDALLAEKADVTDLILATGIEDQTPYLKRVIPASAGNRLLDMIVGGTVAFNQLLKSLTSDNWGSENGVTATYSDGIVTIDSTIARNGIYQNINVINGHRYLHLCKVKSGNAPVTFDYGAGGGSFSEGYLQFDLPANSEWTECNGIITASDTVTRRIYVFSEDEYSGLKVKDIQIIDLTALFGSSTIADYVYSLESGTAGAGVNWLKEHGFISKDYYAYNSGILVSVKPTKHIEYDSGNNVIGSYDLDTPDLYGLFKIDASNNLYADGNTYKSNGEVKLYYEQRTYQSGDESLPNAITDGTNTVVKLDTPTTETADPFTNPQVCENGGSEEYTDTRAYPVPVGHDTIYQKKTDYRYW